MAPVELQRHDEGTAFEILRIIGVNRFNDMMGMYLGRVKN